MLKRARDYIKALAKYGGVAQLAARWVHTRRSLVQVRPPLPLSGHWSEWLNTALHGGGSSSSPYGSP